MLVILIRTIVLYILVLLVMRGMGKREIGQLQPFELVISIMIADLASIPMSDIGVPIFNGIIPILGLLIMHLMISLGNLKSIKFRQAICGKPSILIFRGKIDEEVLIKERYTINELQNELKIAYVNANANTIFTNNQPNNHLIYSQAQNSEALSGAARLINNHKKNGGNK